MRSRFTDVHMAGSGRMCCGCGYFMHWAVITAQHRPAKLAAHGERGRLRLPDVLEGRR